MEKYKFLWIMFQSLCEFSHTFWVKPKILQLFSWRYVCINNYNQLFIGSFQNDVKY